MLILDEKLDENSNIFSKYLTGNQIVKSDVSL
jgi:hypothetical protein